ncbi:MAG TPA: radical SAM protein, partial [Steroidobacteraceae bacterium]|nr:radical SAM protein [Steroidobacteraceae bacterium]
MGKEPDKRDRRSDPLRGRGAVTNPPGRFERTLCEVVDDGWGEADAREHRIATTVEPDRARGMITRNASPDVPFEQSINPYRGCEHGCVYCFARPSHAYLGLSPGLDFETRLFYKADAGRLLATELDAPGYVCRPITLGANTDPYQPIERERRVTRSILEVLAARCHPVSLITKGTLIERDLDLLVALAERECVHVLVSVTTLDDSLKRVLEPRAAAPAARLATIRRLRAAGVPVGVLVAPVIPAL